MKYKRLVVSETAQCDKEERWSNIEPSSDQSAEQAMELFPPNDSNVFHGAVVLLLQHLRLPVGAYRTMFPIWLGRKRTAVSHVDEHGRPET